MSWDLVPEPFRVQFYHEDQRDGLFTETGLVPTFTASGLPAFPGFPWHSLPDVVRPPLCCTPGVTAVKGVTRGPPSWQHDSLPVRALNRTGNLRF